MSSRRHSRKGFRSLARQVPKRDAKVILLPLPAPERVPPLILRLITRWRRLRSAALLSRGVSGWETKTNNSLICRSIRRHSFPWTADGSSRKGRHSLSNRFSRANCPVRNSPQPPPNSRPWCRAAAPHGPTWPSPGLPGTTLSACGCPATGGAGTAASSRGNGGMQRRSRSPISRQRPLPTPRPPLPRPGPAAGSTARGRAESPNVAIDPVLTPAGLISVHYRTAADTLQGFIDGRSGLLGCLVDGPDDGPNAQFQLVDRSQIPLDCPYRQPPLFPQGDDQTDQIDSQSLAAHGQTLQRVLGQPPFPAKGQVRAMNTCSVTSAGTTGMSMTSRVRCTQPPLRVVWHSGQDSGAWTTRPAGSILSRAKSWGRFLRGFFSCSASFLRLAAGWRQASRPPGRRRTAGLPGPLPHLGNGVLLFRDDSTLLAITAGRVSRLACFRSNSGSIVLLCHNCAPTAGVFIRTAAFGKFTSSTLNCYPRRPVIDTKYHVMLGLAQQ